MDSQEIEEMIKFCKSISGCCADICPWFNRNRHLDICATVGRPAREWTKEEIKQLTKEKT